jgi:hypothetical protein
MERIKWEKADLYNLVVSLAQDIDEIEKYENLDFHFHLKSGASWYQISYALRYQTEWRLGPCLVIVEQKMKDLGEREYWNHFPGKEAKELFRILNQKYAEIKKEEKLKADITLEEYQNRIDEIIQNAFKVTKLGKRAFLIEKGLSCYKIYVEPTDLYGAESPHLVIEKHKDVNQLDDAPSDQIKIQGSDYLFDYLIQNLDKKHSGIAVVKMDVIEAIEKFIS